MGAYVSIALKVMERRTRRTDDDDIVTLLDIGEGVDRDPCTEPWEGHARRRDMAQRLWLAAQRGQRDLDEPMWRERKAEEEKHTSETSRRVEKSGGSSGQSRINGGSAHSANVPSEVNPRWLPVPHTCAPIQVWAGTPVPSNASTTSPEKSRPGMRGIVTKGNMPSTAAASDLMMKRREGPNGTA